MRKEYLGTCFRAELPSEGLPARFGVVTAYNPNGRLAPDAANLEADSKLKKCLKNTKVRHFRVTGGSQDGNHQEPGFGVVVDDKKEIEKFARQFHQEAFFWIENGEIYCVQIGDSAMHQVGSWSKRQLTQRVNIAMKQNFRSQKTKRDSGPRANPNDSQEPDKKDLVYGDAGGSLVFIPRHLAVELGNLRDALNSSQTWGELKSRISAERYEQIISPHFENFYDELDMDVELTREESMAEFQSRKTNKDLKIGERAPEDSDAFDSGFVYGLSDGDWPEWPAQEMLKWIPDKIQQQFGRVVATRFNGDYLEFHARKEAEIVAVFKAMGYRCDRDDVLVGKASGTSW